MCSYGSENSLSTHIKNKHGNEFYYTYKNKLRKEWLSKESNGSNNNTKKTITQDDIFVYDDNENV